MGEASVPMVSGNGQCLFDLLLWGSLPFSGEMSTESLTFQTWTQMFQPLTWDFWLWPAAWVPQPCEIPNYRLKKCQPLGDILLCHHLLGGSLGQEPSRSQPKEKGTASKAEKDLKQNPTWLSQTTFLSLYFICISIPLHPANIHRECGSGTREVCSEIQWSAMVSPAVVGIIKLLCQKAHGVNCFICILRVLSFKIM